MSNQLSPARYFNGPNSRLSSLDISLFNKAISVLPIESNTASNFRLILSLSTIVVFNSDCSALLAEPDDDVITVSEFLSYHDT